MPNYFRIFGQCWKSSKTFKHSFYYYIFRTISIIHILYIGKNCKLCIFVTFDFGIFGVLDFVLLVKVMKSCFRIKMRIVQQHKLHVARSLRRATSHLVKECFAKEFFAECLSLKALRKALRQAFQNALYHHLSIITQECQNALYHWFFG